MASSESSARRILLVRHGRSAHVHVGWIDTDGFRSWRQAYETAGIVTGEQAPAAVANLAARAQLVVASDAARAVESARLLCPGREVITSPLLRELDLDCVSLGRLRLPLPAWALAVGCRMLLEKLQGRYPPAHELARITRAATWLDDLSSRNTLTVAVTHASFRKRLAARLLALGWQNDSADRTLKHWSAWSFRRCSGR
jgi:broad specificity phosphatase PhoE